jgi:hypothetical protein
MELEEAKAIAGIYGGYRSLVDFSRTGTATSEAADNVTEILSNWEGAYALASNADKLELLSEKQALEDLSAVLAVMLAQKSGTGAT